MRVVEGAMPDPPEPGSPVWVVEPDGGRIPAMVITARFTTHVFRGDVSVRYPDGTLDLIEKERVVVKEASITIPRTAPDCS